MRGGTAVLLGLLAPAQAAAPRPRIVLQAESTVSHIAEENASWYDADTGFYHDANSDPEHDGVCCGHLDEPACVYVYAEEEGNITIHSCLSDDDPAAPAVQAVPLTSDVYMCLLCGRPDGPACECTDEDRSVRGIREEDEALSTFSRSSDLYGHPCDIPKTTHWCLDSPQFLPLLGESDADGDNATEIADEAGEGATDVDVPRCRHNDTDAAAEEAAYCGEPGERACLDLATGVHSCSSPSPDGLKVAAIQWPDDVPTAPITCLACGNSTLMPTCPGDHPEDDAPDKPPKTCHDFQINDADIAEMHGKLYQNGRISQRETVARKDGLRLNGPLPSGKPTPIPHEQALHAWKQVKKWVTKRNLRNWVAKRKRAAAEKRRLRASQ
jgi:hypothetical protein